MPQPTADMAWVATQAIMGVLLTATSQWTATAYHVSSHLDHDDAVTLLEGGVQCDDVLVR
jgi:hypothetical protein